MGKPYSDRSIYDNELKQLDREIISNRKRKNQTRSNLLWNIDNMKQPSKKLGRLKYVSSLGVFMVLLFVGYQLFANGTSPINEQASTVPQDNHTILPVDMPNFVQESDFEKINWEKKAVEFGDKGIIGNENKSGVIGADMPSLNGQKWMWHLWGITNAKLTVVGFHKDSGTVHQILIDGWTKELGGENNGADAHIPSSVKIPESGEWAILLYTDEKLFDTLVFEINE